MRKQSIIIVTIFLLAISAWVILLAAPATKNNTIISPKCSQTCENKAVNNPQTGFFIFDSFSGNL